MMIDLSLESRDPARAGWNSSLQIPALGALTNFGNGSADVLPFPEYPALHTLAEVPLAVVPQAAARISTEIPQ
jgi:hypothetical protein